MGLEGGGGGGEMKGISSEVITGREEQKAIPKERSCPAPFVSTIVRSPSRFP